MMRLVYPICCGLDVHKKVIVATIVTTDNAGISTYKRRSFSTINSDLKLFHDWLLENNCKHVCMESTGKYWIPVYNYLEADIEVCLTHPKYVKAIKGKKTDKRDSKWIADLYKFDLVRCSFIPPKDFRQLREISIPFQTGIYENCREESSAKLYDCFQYRTCQLCIRPIQ